MRSDASLFSVSLQYEVTIDLAANLGNIQYKYLTTAIIIVTEQVVIYTFLSNIQNKIFNNLIECMIIQRLSNIQEYLIDGIIC